MASIARISIVDLEVYYRVGLTEEERSRPQRLLVTVDMNCDPTLAVLSDRIEKTINYHTVAMELLNYGDGRSWKLLEKLASGMADMILAEFKPQSVTVEVKKFAVPQARYASVTMTRGQSRS